MTQTAAVLSMALLALLSVGCKSTVPFTHELRTQHDLSAEEVRRLQFYVSHTVTLRREIRAKGRTVQDGQLQVTSGKIIEQIVIKQLTPGVPTQVDVHSIRVSFEQGSALEFTLRGAEPVALPLQVEPGRFSRAPNPFPGEHEDEEPAIEIFGSYFLATERETSRVDFHGQQWDAVQDSFRAHLVIDAQSLEEVVESKTVLGGRRL